MSCEKSSLYLQDKIKEELLPYKNYKNFFHAWLTMICAIDCAVSI